MATIGGYTVTTLHGFPPPLPGVVTERITRKMVAGSAFWRTQYIAEPITIQTVTTFTSKASAEASLVLYTSLQGTIVTIIDDSGASWFPIFVHRVVPDGTPDNPSGFTILGAGSANYVLRMSFTVEFMA